MKLKINWGTGILIAIITMVSGMLVLVFIATRQDYYLVDDDYYQKAVNYQQQIEKIKNANELIEKVNINYSGKNLKLDFPLIFQHEKLEGTIQLYSPVNGNHDLTFPVKIDDKLSQLLSLEKLPKGRYKIKLDWTANDKSYYQELEIMHRQ
ncbi:FixH family protein [Sunxiuqinia sp. A32]|uniref:FixH family protein n=1 Tax=Sunxiuqinia sp. A32 TaxID=3461496 RepID=UPI0040465DE4